MKKLLFIASVLLCTVQAFAQNFEGKIIYKNTFISKTPNVTNEQFSSMMGATQEYYIKGADYKSVTNGTFAQWQIYQGKDNKLYNKFSNSESVFWNDCSTNDDSIIKIEQKKAVIDIAGYKCDEVTLTCKNSTQKYYFNAKLGIDAKLFVNHKYSNWYDYVKLANAVPLKMVIETPQMNMTSEATEVKAMKLDAKEFQLPANAKVEKSPF